MVIQVLEYFKDNLSLDVKTTTINFELKRQKKFHIICLKFVL